MAEESKRLGRGLAALLGDQSELSVDPPSLSTRKLPIETLKPNRLNPRKSFPDLLLDDLAQSIRERGVLQPLIVRPASLPNQYEIIAGERRWRAAQRAGLSHVPAICIEADDRKALEIAIIENVQRADLNALEEAEGYQRLLDEFNYSHQTLASVIGKSRSYISNALRLLKLPAKTRGLLAAGEITAGHARALLAVADPDAVAETIKKKNLSVRDVEAMSAADSQPKERRAADQVSAEVRDLEKRLSDSIGMKVRVISRGEAGEIRIHFAALDQLDLVIAKLSV